jgi:tetratricopeptide (TPR) repeat protein
VQAGALASVRARSAPARARARTTSGAQLDRSLGMLSALLVASALAWAVHLRQWRSASASAASAVALPPAAASPAPLAAPPIPAAAPAAPAAAQPPPVASQPLPVTVPVAVFVRRVATETRSAPDPLPPDPPSTPPAAAAAPPLPGSHAPALDGDPKARSTAEAERLVHEGTAALLGGRIARAAELLQRATKADRSYAPAWRNLGLALEQRGRNQDAAAAYRKCLHLAPDGLQAQKLRERIAALEQRERGAS